MEMKVDHIAYKCSEAAYKVLSDSHVSKTTSEMPEEGREAVAREIAKELEELLEQELAEAKEPKPPKRMFIYGRPYVVNPL